uniref:Ig-like domain-containing protein n=1 Tax=Neogobius melanostomus TaxID=47308 RepID=A0A8C6U3B9_9GOBI
MAHPVQALDRLTSPEIELAADFKQTHIVKNGGIVTLHVAFKGKPTPVATWSRVDGELPVMGDINTSDSFSTLTIEGCTRYEAGKYTLSLENNSGRKSITFTVKVLDTPGPPGAISFKDVSCGALTMMWDAPTNDGGARIHHYLVDKREASRLAWQPVILSITILECQEEDSGTYRCVCTNSKGEASDYATLDVSGGGYTTFSSRRRSPHTESSKWHLKVRICVKNLIV